MAPPAETLPAKLRAPTRAGVAAWRRTSWARAVALGLGLGVGTLGPGRAAPADARAYACAPPAPSLLPRGIAPTNTQVWLRFPAPSVDLGVRSVELARGHLTLVAVPAAGEPPLPDARAKAAVTRQDFVVGPAVLVRLSPTRPLHPQAHYRVVFTIEDQSVTLGEFETAAGDRRTPPAPPQVKRTIFVRRDKPCYKCASGPYVQIELDEPAPALPPATSPPTSPDSVDSVPAPVSAPTSAADALLYEVSYLVAPKAAPGRPGVPAAPAAEVPGPTFLVSAERARLRLGDYRLCAPPEAPLPESLRVAGTRPSDAPAALRVRLRTVDVTGESSEPLDLTIDLRRPRRTDP